MGIFDRSQDRRSAPRKAVNLRGLIIAPGMELRCVILDLSDAGLRVRLDRAMALPSRLVIIDLAAGVAREAEPAWAKGLEAGLRTAGRPLPLGGLVPTRFAAARDAWLRLGGR